MCIVIDTCTFASVFDPNSRKHNDFRPVRRWIVSGNGKVVYGGTKYKQELRKTSKYLRIIAELSKASRVVAIPDESVDAKQREIEKAFNHRDFDDPHIVAIVIVSGCRLILQRKVAAFWPTSGALALPDTPDMAAISPTLRCNTNMLR